MQRMHIHFIYLQTNIHGTVTYISYYDSVFSLKMACVAKTCCWWLITNKAVYRLDLYLFYLPVYLKTIGMPCLKKREKTLILEY